MALWMLVADRGHRAPTRCDFWQWWLGDHPMGTCCCCHQRLCGENKRGHWAHNSCCAVACLRAPRPPGSVFWGKTPPPLQRWPPYSSFKRLHGSHPADTLLNTDQWRGTPFTVNLRKVKSLALGYKAARSWSFRLRSFHVLHLQTPFVINCLICHKTCFFCTSVCIVWYTMVIVWE